MCADSGPDTLDLQDFLWLQANDLERRARLRRFDSDDAAFAHDRDDAFDRHPGVETEVSRTTRGAEASHHGVRDASVLGETAQTSSDADPDGARETRQESVLSEEPEYGAIDAEQPVFEWRDIAWDADEFDDSATRDEDAKQVRVEGKVSGRERAEQAAIDLGRQHGWDRAGIRLLAELLDVRYWGPTKAAVQRLLARGVTADELELARHLREFWRDRSEFSIDFGRMSRPARSGSTVAESAYGTLSWLASLRLVRVTRTLPDVVEVERFLDDLYTRWYSSERLRCSFRSFIYYLLYCLDHIETRPELRNLWLSDLEAATASPDPAHDERHVQGYATPMSRQLQELGVWPIRASTSLGDQLGRR